MKSATIHMEIPFWAGAGVTRLKTFQKNARFVIRPRPLQNWRSGSSAESRICNFIGKCGGLPTCRYDGWEFCRGLRPCRLTPVLYDFSNEATAIRNEVARQTPKTVEFPNRETEFRDEAVKFSNNAVPVRHEAAPICRKPAKVCWKTTLVHYEEAGVFDQAAEFLRKDVSCPCRTPVYH
jgi:hypothetical protein